MISPPMRSPKHVRNAPQWTNNHNMKPRSVPTPKGLVKMIRPFCFFEKKVFETIGLFTRSQLRFDMQGTAMHHL